MSQLSFIELKLDKKTKREVTRILRSYGNLNALIESMRIELPLLSPKMTVNYEASESQRDNQFHSSTEDLALRRMHLELKIKQKEKLDIIYDSIAQEKKDIWQLRFIGGYTDEQTMIHLNMTSNRNKYFGEKYELMGMIADSFYLW